MLFLEDCTAFLGNESAGETFLTIIGMARIVVQILQILVPIALIVWGSIDIGKAVIAGDEKKIKEAQKPFVKRIVAAIIVFLIPWLVNIIIGFVGSDDWHECWTAAKGYKLSNLKSSRDPMGDK